jgi:hypothetical protein
MDYIHLAWDRNYFWAFVNLRSSTHITVMHSPFKSQFYKKRGEQPSSVLFNIPDICDCVP